MPPEPGAATPAPGAAPPAVLLTRPAAQSEALAAELAGDGIRCLLWPLTEVRRLPGPVALPPGTQGLLFTSAHGVAAFAGGCAARDLPALCVGAQTAQAARAAGFARVETGAGDAAALAALARGAGLARLFHPTGRDRAADLAALLAPDGIAVTEAVLYAAEETGPPPEGVRRALAAGGPALLTVWSRRNGAILARRLAGAGIGPRPGLRVLAISAAAAGPLRAAGWEAVTVAARPDGAAMRAAIRAACGRRA